MGEARGRGPAPGHAESPPLAGPLPRSTGSGAGGAAAGPWNPGMWGAVRAPPTRGFRGVHREHRRGASLQRAAERGAGAGARLLALLTVTQLPPLCPPQAGGHAGTRLETQTSGVTPAQLLSNPPGPGSQLGHSDPKCDHRTLFAAPSCPEYKGAY